MSNIGKNRRNEARESEPLNPAIAKAREQMSRGDADGAAATLRQLLKQPDLSLNTRMDAARALGSAGATGDAITTFLETGRKALDAGDLPMARSSFASAHTLDQKGYEALFELGRVDLAESKREAALEKFVEVLRKSNLRHLPALYEAAVLYEADGQTDQAIAAYKKIVERDRHHVPTLTRLAGLYRKKGNLGDALGYYLQGARAAMAAMQYHEARALVDNALQIEDDNWEARRLEAELAKLEPAAAKAAEPPKAGGMRPAPAAQQPAKAVAPSAPPPARPQAAPQAPPARAAQGAPSQPAVTTPARPAPRPAAAPAAAAPAAPAPVMPSAKPAAPAPRPAVASTPTPPAKPVPTTSSPPQPKSTPVEPAARGSDMDNELPAEVTLLEKQSEVTSKLAAITAEVAEAYKKRLAIERDIKAAQATLDALSAQRGEVESSIAALRAQLDQVNQAKAAEDKALEELRAKIEATRANLEKLANLPQFITDAETKSAHFATLISNATATLETAQKKVADAAGAAGAVEKNAAALGTRVAAARAQADELQSQLQAILGESKTAKADATAAAASIAELKATVATLQQLKAQVDAARSELSTMAPAIEAKKAQAAAAIGQLDRKRAERDSQFAAVAAQMSAPAAQPPKAPPAAPKPAPAPAQTPQVAAGRKGDPGKFDVDALVVAGRLDEALRAAREGANGAADLDAKYVDAASRLRESGNAAAAAKACEKLVSSGSQSIAGRYCLALSYVDLKRFKDAMSIFEALPDGDYAVLKENGIGLCLRGLGRTDEAAQHFSKALEIPGQPDGQYRDVLYNLADLYESRGDQESLNLALWSFEEIQAGAPDYRDVGERINALKDQLSKIEVPEPSPVLTRAVRGGRESKF
jgi:tetratricopeptide (TPR) repeat protein